MYPFQLDNRKKICPDVQLDNDQIQQVNSAKFLGLVIDENLSWDKHVENILHRISSGIFALRRMAAVCDIKTLRTVYFALVDSHISYGISIYGATSNKNLNKILVKQKNAIRIMLGIRNKDVSVVGKFIELGILTVYSNYVLNTIWCAREHCKPFSKSKKNPHNTRNNFIVDRHRLEFFKKKTTYQASNFLKYIPSHIKNISNSSIFKQKLKEFLLIHPLYSFEDLYNI